LRALIVDDEPQAVERVAELLAIETDVEVVGAFGGPREALERAAGLEPDVAFVDMQMPDMDGLTLARALRGSTRGLDIVFITGHEHYAVGAFDVAAADYLLKPIQPKRFHAAVERLRARTAPPVRSRELSVRSRELSALLYPQRIMVKDAQRTTIVDVADIDWIVAAGNYSELHLGSGGSVLLREPLAHLAARLDEGRFVQIHRTMVVNLDRVAAIESTFRREQIVTLRSGVRLTVAASRAAALDAALRGREPAA
jgi:two-component system LytT family response regulator